MLEKYPEVNRLLPEIMMSEIPLLTVVVNASAVAVVLSMMAREVLETPEIVVKYPYR
ncbi:hypothetical protein D3C87_1669610 [compost metagenome]